MFDMCLNFTPPVSFYQVNLFEETGMFYICHIHYRNLTYYFYNSDETVYKKYKTE